MALDICTSMEYSKCCDVCQGKVMTRRLKNLRMSRIKFLKTNIETDHLECKVWIVKCESKAKTGIALVGEGDLQY